MKKRFFSFIILTLFILPNVSVLAGEPASTNALQHSSQASAHSVSAVLSGLISTGQVASAVSAVPLRISADAGVVSGQSSRVLMEAATAPIGTPLTVTDETYSAGPPPSEALKTKDTAL